MEIIGLLVAGLVIGALARLVLRGRQRVPLWLHLVVGVVGVQVGYWLAALIGVDETRGIDWIRWIISIAVAAATLVAVDRIWVSRDLGAAR